MTYVHNWNGPNHDTEQLNDCMKESRINQATTATVMVIWLSISIKTQTIVKNKSKAREYESTIAGLCRIICHNLPYSYPTRDERSFNISTAVTACLK